MFGLTRHERERLVASVPQWWHSIDVGRGVVTPGAKGAGTPGGPHAFMQAELESLALPDLHGKSVLDVGALNGYYSFAAERAGASRVVALDYHSWLPLADGTPAPARRGFEVARKILKSRVEPVLGDLMAVDAAALGRFDVVLFLGVLNHLEDPLGGMRRVAELTSGLAVIQSLAMSAGALADQHALLEFRPRPPADGDRTDWYLPNVAAIDALCRAAGFASTQEVVGAGARERAPATGTRHYSAVVQARR